MGVYCSNFKSTFYDHFGSYFLPLQLQIPDGKSYKILKRSILILSVEFLQDK